MSADPRRRAARARRQQGGTALYVYGFIRSPGVDLGYVGLDVDGQPARVHTMAVDRIGAVVSPYPDVDRVLPVRRNLDAHHRVGRDLLKLAGGLLPMRFGHVVPGDRELLRLLAAHRAEIEEELGYLDGKVEMALKVFWDVDNIYEYFVDKDPVLTDMRDRAYGRGVEPSRQAKIELGRAFAERLDADRETHVRQVTEALQPGADEIEADEAGAEKMVMNLTLLVDRPRLPNLEQHVHDVAARFSGLYLFRYAGPFPPYHFVGLDLGAPPQRAAAARS